ncbi:hypothetical protein H1R20_g4143, partial [Candolleomyces eurysporus]
MTDIEKALSVLELRENDPLNRWGCRKVKEKLRLDGVHVTRDWTMDFLRSENVEAVANRHPLTRKQHKHGLYSAGPNEEWCVDGHEKLLTSMGIGVYGITDKFSRLELGLWATPNPRDQDLPVAMWLRVVKKLGGMSVTLTCDKGTELGRLITFATRLRDTFQPCLDEQTVPTVVATKSVKNITRERAWRPLWENELSNVAYEYKNGQIDAGYQPNDDFHQAIARWTWAGIVQERLDRLIEENSYHKVRKQKDSLLPTGGRHIDFFSDPTRYNGVAGLLVPIPEADIDRLLAEHDKVHLTRFGDENQVILFEDLYHSIGSPRLVAKDGWKIFSTMIELYRSRF